VLPDIGPVTLPTELIVRESCAAVRPAPAGIVAGQG
jgi:hypothetical protein